MNFSDSILHDFNDVELEEIDEINLVSDSNIYKFCISCGLKNKDKHKFCTNCGIDLQY